MERIKQPIMPDKQPKKKRKRIVIKPKPVFELKLIKEEIKK